MPRSDASTKSCQPVNELERIRRLIGEAEHREGESGLRDKA